MPKVLTRPILHLIQSQALTPLEILEVSVDPPYTKFDYLFVNNLEVITFGEGAKIYTPLGFSRSPYQSESGEAVDRVSITIDDVDRFWARITAQNVLAGARIRIRKVFVGHMEFDRDAITIFDGSIGAPTFDESTFSVEIRAVGDYQQTEMPPRTYQPNCNAFLGNGRCTVDMTLTVNTRTVVAGPGSTRGVLMSKGLGGVAAQHWTAGYVRCLVGPEKGQVRPIDSSLANRLDLIVPFNFTMQGSKFSVVRGCRKTKEDCDARFQNINNYQGFSEVPQTPIIDA